MTYILFCYLVIFIPVVTIVMADMSALRRNVVKTFSANPFIPLSGPLGIFTNKHWQTIIGSEALQQKFKGAYPR